MLLPDDILHHKHLFLYHIQLITPLHSKLNLLPHLFSYQNICQLLTLNNIQHIILSQFINCLLVPLFMIYLCLAEKLTIKLLLYLKLFLFHVYLLKVLFGLIGGGLFDWRCDLVLFQLLWQVVSRWVLGKFQCTCYVVFYYMSCGD